MIHINSPQDHKQRALKSVNSKFIPNNFLFLDTETKARPGLSKDMQYFYLGWSCLWVRDNPISEGEKLWEYFDSEILLCKYISNMAVWVGDLYLVGHNIFFDLQACGFFKYFTLWEWNLKFYYDRGVTYILKCTKGKDKITVVSTTNWFDQSLANLGKTLNLPKGDIDFKTATDAKLKSYCKRDVEILVVALSHYIDFIQVHKLGKFSLTKASQAFTSYRHRFMDHKIYLHTNADVQALERAAYMGGRTECFQIGPILGGPFVTLDINAMYPYVMKNEKYPYKLVSYHRGLSLEVAVNLLKTFSVVAQIEVVTTNAVYAVKVKGKTLFPIGRFVCNVCSGGLSLALKRGDIVRIMEASVYRRADLFSGYVDYFHDLRVKYKKDNNDIFLLLCKYMHNSLYGKFAQLAIQSDITEMETDRTYSRENSFNQVTGRNIVITTLMNKQIVQYPEGEGDNSNVAIAAHITEYARLALWELISEVGTDRVLYCDTDSIKIAQKALKYVKHEIDPNKLGALKVEDESWLLNIQGSKNYRTEQKRKIKGIPHRAVETTPNSFTFDSFTGQIGHLRKELDAGALVTKITRTLKHKYSKGNVNKEGIVTPFDLSGSEPPF